MMATSLSDGLLATDAETRPSSIDMEPDLNSFFPIPSLWSFFWRWCTGVVAIVSPCLTTWSLTISYVNNPGSEPTWTVVMLYVYMAFIPLLLIGLMFMVMESQARLFLFYRLLSDGFLLRLHRGPIYKAYALYFITIAGTIMLIPILGQQRGWNILTVVFLQFGQLAVLYTGAVRNYMDNIATLLDVARGSPSSAAKHIQSLEVIEEHLVARVSIRLVLAQRNETMARARAFLTCSSFSQANAWREEFQSNFGYSELMRRIDDREFFSCERGTTWTQLLGESEKRLKTMSNVAWASAYASNRFLQFAPSIVLSGVEAYVFYKLFMQMYL